MPIFLLFLLLTPVLAFSMPKIDSKVSFIFYNQREYRGAEIWPAPFILPGIEITINNNWLLSVPNIAYLVFPENKHHDLAIGAEYFNDNGPLIEVGSHDKDYRNQRNGSMQLYIDYQFNFGFYNFMHIGTKATHDIGTYNSPYIEFTTGTPILPYVKAIFEVSFAGTKANQYLYGKDAQSGVGYYSVDLVNAIPEIVPNLIILNGLRKSWVAQQVNRDAEFILGNSQNLSYTFRAIYSF